MTNSFCSTLVCHFVYKDESMWSLKEKERHAIVKWKISAIKHLWINADL
jgi:hypothetical protein